MYLGKQPSRGLISTADIDDNAVTLDHLAHQADGSILTYGTDTAPALLAPSSTGNVLTTKGAGALPAFDSVGTSLAIYTDQEAAGGAAGDAHAINGWRTITLNTEVVDADGIGALSSNAITLAAGTYRIECYSQGDADAATFSTSFSRVRDTTNSVTLVVGPRGVGTGDSGVTVSSSKVAYVKGQFTLSGSAAFEYQVYPVSAVYDITTETTNTGEINIAAQVYLEKI